MLNISREFSPLDGQAYMETVCYPCETWPECQSGNLDDCRRHDDLSALVQFTAERIRREPFQMFWNNCFIKSLKFRKHCREMGVTAKVVIALVVTSCDRFPLPPKIVWFHTWAEVDGTRIEVARPLDEKNTANTFDIDIRPIISVSF